MELDTTWLIITVVSLMFSALFSGTEIAFITSDRVRTELDVKKGGPIGAIGVFPTEIPEGRGEPELGYWIARPYWGQGLIPEAVEAMLRRQFREMGAERVWCAHFPGNERSRRVQEKCGFRHVCDTPPSPWPDGTERPGVCQAITRQEWEVRHG